MEMAEIAAKSGLYAFAAASVWIALRDVSHMTIGNRAVLGLAVAWAALAVMSGMGAAQAGLSVLVALAVLAAGFAAFAGGLVGGGDAKYAAVAALWVGPACVPGFLFWTALAGGVLALAVMAMRAAALPSPARGWRWANRLHSGTEGVPYGVALSAGALAVLPYGHWAA